MFCWYLKGSAEHYTWWQFLASHFLLCFSLSSMVYYSVIVWVSITVKRHHNHGNIYKEKTLNGVVLQFKVLDHFHHGRKHSSVQADMMLKELWHLHLDLQVAGRDCYSSHILIIWYNLKFHPSSGSLLETCLCLLIVPYICKVILLNSDTPYWPIGRHFQRYVLKHIH